MGTETINIVVQESGSQAAASNVASVGEAATLSDKSLTDLLAASGATTTGMGALATASGVSNAALNQLTAGATSSASALLSASTEATAASSRLTGVATSSTSAATGMQSAGNAGNALVASMRAAAAASSQAAIAENDVAAASARAAAGITAAGHAAETGAAHVHHMGEESEVLQNKMERLELTLVALGLALGVHELVELTDTFANMSNQLERVKTSTGDFANKQNDVLRIAQAARQPLEAVNSIYVDMSIALKNTNISAEQISRSIQTLATAATVSGKSVSEASSALSRLGLAMRQGDVSGRGFLQFLIQFPEVGDRVSEALGFVGKNGFGNFVKAVNDGKVHTEDFIKALNVISPAIDAEMKHMEVTIASAFVVVKNAFLDYIGRADTASGVSARIAQAILQLAQYIPQVVGVIATLTVGLGAYGIAVGTAALATGALAFSVAGIIGIVAALGTALAFFGDQIKLSSDGTVTALSLIIGVFKSLVQWGQELYTWLTKTDAGFKVLEGAAIALTGAFGRLIAVTLFGWLTALVGAITSVVVAVAPAVLAIGALVAIILGLRYAWIAATQGFAAANADIGRIKDGVIALGTSMKDQLLKNIQASTGGITKAFSDSKDAAHDLGHAVSDDVTPQIVRFGQSAGGAFKTLGDSASGGAIQVVNGFSRGSAAIIKMGNDANDAKDKLHTSTSDMSGSVHQLESATHQAATNIESDFNNIAAAAGTMASTVISDVSRAVSGLGSLTGSLGSSAGALSKSSASGASPASPGFGLGDYSPSAGYSKSGITPSTLSGSGYDTSVYSPSNYTSGFPTDSGSYGGSGSTTPTDLAFRDGGSFMVGGHGGPDSQLVQFMASPTERVTVETAAQQRQSGGGSTGGGQRPIVVQMTVNTPDANSFRQNETQTMARLANRLKRVTSQLGN